MLATARSKRALSRMKAKDANRFGLENRYRSLFRSGDAVNNLAPPVADDGVWMQLVSVPLGNGEDDGVERLVSGDTVGVVTTFDLLSAVEDATDGEGVSDEAGRAIALIRDGEWRRDPRAGDAWVGVPVSQGFSLGLDDPDDKGRARSIVSKWIKSGVLVEVSRMDSRRKMRSYVEVAAPAQSEDATSDASTPDAGPRTTRRTDLCEPTNSRLA